MNTETRKKLVPLSKTAHADARWRPFTDWRFAAGDLMAPLAGVEVVRAAGSFPMVFARNAERIELVALLGLKPGQNVFVDANGAWATDYAPAMLRSQPFAIGVTPAGQSLMCINEGSSMVTTGTSEGEPIFTPEGELSPKVEEAAKFLRGVHATMAGLWKAADALWQHKCLQPLEFPEGIATPLKDSGALYQADEAALRGLAPAALAELMASGAIKVAYAQLVSLQKLPLLQRLAEVRDREAAAAVVPDLSMLEKDGTLVFSSLR